MKQIPGDEPCYRVAIWIAGGRKVSGSEYQTPHDADAKRYWRNATRITDHRYFRQHMNGFDDTTAVAPT